MNKDKKQRLDVDPVLEKISSHIPDDEIDFLFPFRSYNTQGRLREFKTSQLYRVHILTMIKGVTSFNKVCAEIKSRRFFRDFCHFKNFIGYKKHTLRLWLKIKGKNLMIPLISFIEPANV